MIANARQGDGEPEARDDRKFKYLNFNALDAASEPHLNAGWYEAGEQPSRPYLE
jgi:hypothetical protein